MRILWCWLSVVVVLLLGLRVPPASADDGGGRVSGIVRVVGDVPAPFVAERGSDVQACGAPRHEAQTLLVGEGGALENAFVWIEGVPDAPALPADPAGYVVDQQQCVYEPHALLVPVGATVVFTNSDPVLHNVQLRHDTENKHFNKVGRQGQELKFTATAPGPLHVVCNLHRWMDAIIMVAAHRYYAQTGADGRFAFDDVPSGDYTLHVYHEALGEKQVPLNVRPLQMAEVAVGYPAPASAPPPFGLER